MSSSPLLTDAPVFSEGCFHCGLPVPAGARYPIEFEGQTKDACCRGCQAVAQTIIDSGQSAYYHHRTALPATAREAEAELAQLGLYDLPEIQESFVRVEAENVREAALILENIVCAACIWLNERHIAALPGVLSVEINYATRRARVRWDNSRIQLSAILKAVSDIGYIAHPFDPGRSDDLYKRERNTAIKRLAIAGLGMMQVMMYALPTYTATDMTEDIRLLMRWASLVLTIPVVVYSAWPFFIGAWRDLKRRALGMDVPVALGVGTAFVASVYSTFSSEGEVYYDSVTMFIFLLLTGRFLEMNARRRAGAAVEELVKLIPAATTRLPAWPARDEEKVPVARLTVGDHVLVRPGETLPADGVVVEGESAVSEAMLTGESQPIAKRVDAKVVGGSLNEASPLVVRVEKLGADTRLASIVRLLDRAQSEKPRIGQLADRAAGWFVGLLLVITAAVGLAWYAIDPSKVLWIVVSILVVTCPCALGLATPAALTTATGRLTRLGLLTTRGHALETLARATDLVLDKTGTLTHGSLSVARVVTLGHRTEAEVRGLAAALEAGSEHPISRALREGADAGLRADAIRNTPGRGVEGTVAGRAYRLGSPRFTAESDTPPRPPATDTGEHPNGHESWVALAEDGALIAWFALADTPRADAATALAALQAQGLHLHLVSGDAEPAVKALAQALGITSWRAGALPEDKLAYVKALQQQGRIVAMVGDGINDAPVLAGAEISIAMGEGADVAQAAADMVMLGSRLTTLSEGVALARKTQRIIRENLGWALGYNLIAIPAAALGYVTPWIAGIGMSASSLLVVLNALRLSDFKQSTADAPRAAEAALR
ncbi:heavy metal translocating P-type ATPase [Thiobacillus denitrificans ATCC 25259]|uniref:Heavy metal translocating P-type ATPase n=1 Tax=Thiobacillus denitrificans (strain ATCC 25259 / T1) TaxID=292415 RepID=Q3SH92_THIDA|nr:heavy metal translocating P-type ATPase [Thiobacillus denitrificans]AAZ97997.1 heavy metal translocating P-type ATPase [Thiobacillus denitrificans ATCC 25259]